MILARQDAQAIFRAAHTLSRGGTAILPCDTIYGICGVAPDTRERLLDIKGRGENKPFLMLIADTTWIATFSDTELPLALRPFWPGPLTVLFPDKSGGKSGFRMPEDEFLTGILALVRKPVYSTSVNLTGLPHLWKISEIIDVFRDKVDMIVDAGDLPEAIPSTIVDITTTPFRIVRQGALRLPDKLFK